MAWGKEEGAGVGRGWVAAGRGVAAAAKAPEAKARVEAVTGDWVMAARGWGAEGLVAGVRVGAGWVAGLGVVGWAVGWGMVGWVVGTTQSTADPGRKGC